MSSTRPSYQDFAERRERIGVIGLGYVGLPLAHAFATKFDVIGIDISTERVAELRAGKDRTGELTADQLKATRLGFSSDLADLKSCRLVIVTVPTPIDDHKNPDLTPLVKASASVGRNLAPGTTVVYESTVYPLSSARAARNGAATSSLATRQSVSTRATKSIQSQKS